MKRRFYTVLSCLLVVFLVGCDTTNTQIEGGTRTYNSYVDTHEHTFSNEWSKDDNYHWHAATCDHKQEVRDKAPHTYGDWNITVPATETTVGLRTKICTVCGHEVNEPIQKITHTHTPTDPVKENEVQPDCTKTGSYDLVTYCSVCGDELSRETITVQALGHSYVRSETAATYESDGVIKYTCSRCGDSYTEKGADKLEHHYASEWSSNATKHWHACTDQGYENLKKDETSHTFTDEVTPATYTAGGYTTHTCNVCGYTFRDNQTDPLEHHYSANWNHDKSTHWHDCLDEGYTNLKGNEESHTFNSVVTPATYTSSGYTTYTCIVCGYSYIDNETPQQTHTYSSEWSSNASKHWHACTDAGYENLAQDEAEHHFVHYASKNPTCTEVGYNEYDVCDICGYSTYQEIPANGHRGGAPVRENNIDPNCLNAGSYDTVIYCEDCHEVISREHVDVPALGHDYQVTSETPATYESDGSITYTCSRCGDVHVEKGEDQLQHSYASEWSYDESKHWHTCTDLGFESLKNGEQEHNFVAIETVTPTDIEDGYTLYRCSACNYEHREMNYATGTLAKISFTLNDDGVSYTANKANTSIEGELCIPGYYNGLPVTKIGDFQQCTNITSVRMHADIQSIAGLAFYRCTSLESITFGKGLTSLGNGVFSNCTSLHEVELPDGIQSMEFLALSSDANVYYRGSIDNWLSLTRSINCSANIHLFIDHSASETTEVVIPEGVTEIKEAAFINCKQVTAFVLPDSLTAIRGYSFSKCTSLSHMELGPNVNSIGSDAFRYCTALTSLIVSCQNVTATFDYLEGCTALSYLSVPVFNTRRLFGSEENIPESLTDLCITHPTATITKGALKDCTHLEKLTIPFVGGSPTENQFLGYIFNGNYYSNNPSVVPSSLKEVVIGNSATSIPNYSFYKCTSLEKISIEGGKSLTTVEQYAFSGCSNITDTCFYGSIDNWLDISGIEYLPGDHHLYLDGTDVETTNVVISNACPAISNYAFSKCRNITSVIFSNSVETMGIGVFSGCSSLKNIVLTDGLTAIGSGPFGECSSMTDIYYIGTTQGWLNIANKNQIPYSVNVHLYLDGSEEETTSVIIPEGNTSIDDYAFFNCHNITSVTFNEGLVSIGDYAFTRCDSLASVIIPDTVTSIGTSAFAACSSLKAATLSSNIHHIGDTCFSACTSLTDVYYRGSLRNWISIEGLSSITANIHLYLDGSEEETTEITLPSDVTFICENAFTHTNNINYVYYYGTLEDYLNIDGLENVGRYTHLYLNGNEEETTSIVLPSDITEIKPGTFSGCVFVRNIYYYGTLEDWLNISGKSGLGTANIHLYLDGNEQETTSIVIPNGVTTIDAYEFHNCKQITGVIISDTVTSIGESAFQGCPSLTNIRLSSNLTSFGINVFSYSDNIASVTYYGSLENWLNISGKGVINGDVHLYIDNSAIETTTIVLPNDLTVIDYYAFKNCSSITTVIMPDTVNTINRDAFANCRSLTTVQWSSHLYTIGQTAFQNCTSLTTVVVPDSVRTINSGAFKGCTSLRSITLPFIGQDKTYNRFLGYIFGASGFSNQASYIPPSLQEVIVSNSCTSIANNAFRNCSTITTVVIGDNVTTIGEYAFAACSSLESITLGSGVTSIARYAFSGCREITNFTYRGTVDQWKAISKDVLWRFNILVSTIHCSDGDASITD